MQGKASILVVDDDESTRTTLGLILGRQGLGVESAGTAAEALAKARARFYNAALVDMKLPDMPGVELMAVLKELHPEMAIIVATAFASMETAVASLNQGASAYITKPLNLEGLCTSLAKRSTSSDCSSRYEDSTKRCSRSWPNAGAPKKRSARAKSAFALWRRRPLTRSSLATSRDASSFGIVERRRSSATRRSRPSGDPSP